MSMTRDTLLGLSLAALCLVSPRLSASTATVGAGESANYSALGWDEPPAEGGEATITLGDGATLTFDAAPALAKLTVEGNGTLAKADGVALAIKELIVNGTPSEGSALPFDLQAAQYTTSQKETNFSFFNKTTTSGDYALSGVLGLGNRHWVMAGGAISCSRFLTNANSAGNDVKGCSVFEMTAGKITVTGNTATESTEANGDVVFAKGGNASAAALSPVFRMTLSGEDTVLSVPDGTVSLSDNGVLEGVVTDGARLSAYKMIGLDGMNTSSRGGHPSWLKVSNGGILALGKEGATGGLLKLKEDTYPCQVRLEDGAILEANGDWRVVSYSGSQKGLYFDGATTVRPNGHTITLGYLAAASGAMSIEGSGTVALANASVGGYTGAIAVGEGTVLDLSDTGSGVSNAITVNGTVRLGLDGACRAAGTGFSVTLGETGKVAFMVASPTVQLPAALGGLTSKEQLELTDAVGRPIALDEVALEATEGGATVRVPEAALSLATYYGTGSGAWDAIKWAADSGFSAVLPRAPGTESPAPEAILGNGGTVTVGEGMDLTLRRLSVNGINKDKKTHVEQTGGTLRLTETAHSDSAVGVVPDALHIGQASGNSLASYTLKGGELLLPEGWVFLGGSTWHSTLDVQAGLLRARGLCASTKQDPIFRQSGGVVVLGDGGLAYNNENGVDTRTFAMTGGAIVAEADTTLDLTNAAKRKGIVSFDNEVTLAALPGKTLTVKGPVPGTGTLRIGMATLPDEMAGAFETTACTGTVELSAATLGIAGVTLEAGSMRLDLGDRRGFPVTLAEGVPPEACTVTLRLTEAEAMAGKVENALVAGGAFGLGSLRVLDPTGGEMDLTDATFDGNTLTLGAAAFTIPEAWSVPPSRIPTRAQAFAPSSAFALAEEPTALRTLGGAPAYVGQVASSATIQTFGGKAKATKENPAGAVEGSVWLKVTGGDHTVLAGGSDASGWNTAAGAAVSSIKGDVLLNMTGGTAGVLLGGFWKDGVGICTIEGNVAAVVEGDAVLAGAAAGAGLLAHNQGQRITGSSLLWIRNLQAAPSVAESQTNGDAAVLCGGPLYDTNTESDTIVEGGSALLVDVPEGASGDFARTLVGGAVSTATGNTTGSGNNWATEKVRLRVAKRSEVRVSAPDTVTFPGDIVGGGMAGTDLNPDNKGYATVEGDASVTLAGGVYAGTVRAGGHGNHAAVSGTATLTLRGGDFSAATMLPGNADGKTTLAVVCEATVKALTAFDVIDLSAEGSSLAVTEAFVLPSEGTVELRLPEGAAVGSVLPLALPEGMASEETLARLSVVSGNRRYGAALSDGRPVVALPEVSFTRPATQAWAEATMAFPGMGTFLAEGSLSLNGDAAYDVTVGGTVFTGAQLVGPEGKTVSLFGGAEPYVESVFDKPIRLRVAGGDFSHVAGGSDAGSWNGGAARSSLFGKDILVEMAGGRTDYVSGGSYNDAANQTYEGNVAVVLSGDAVVRGSAFGGGGTSHGSASVFGTAEAPVGLSVTVRNVQADNSATADYFSANTGPRVGAIVGGSVYGTSANPKQTVYGDTAVAVELAEDAAGKAFAKQLIGGMWVPKPNEAKTPGSDATFAVTGQASVTVSAPVDTVFQRDVTGGHWVEGSYTACPMVLGSSSVTLNGGVYEGTVTAGSMGGGTYKALTPATLTVGAKGAAFRGLVQGGRAADKELRLEGTMTLDGGTLDLASFTRVSGEGTVAVKAGTLDVGALRASEGVGLLRVSEAAAGTIAVSWDTASEGATVTLPIVGDVASEAFAVTCGTGVPVSVLSAQPSESGIVLGLATFAAPLEAVGVSGAAAWPNLRWQGSDGVEAPADSVAAWTGERILTLAGDAEVTLGSIVKAKPLSIGGTGTLTLAAAEDGRLTAETVTVGTDTVLEAGAATLSGVTVAEGKTLTVRDADTVSLTAQNAVKGGTLRVEGVAFERSARYAAGEATLDVGSGASLNWKADGQAQLENPIVVSGTGALTLSGKDAVGWDPGAAKLRNTRIVTRGEGVVRKPYGTVESVRCTYEMGGTSRVEVRPLKLKEDGSYDAGFALCRGARIVAVDGSPSLTAAPAAEEEGGADSAPGVALRCTSSGYGFASPAPGYLYVEFETRAEATLTVDVMLRHFAVMATPSGTSSEFDQSAFPVRKTGAGTLALTKANVTEGANPLEVLEGTLRLVGEGAWDAPVTLGGTLAGEGTGTSVASLTLGEGAAIDASAGAVRVTGAVTLAEGVASVPVMLSAEAKAGDVVLACAEPSAEVAAALKAEGFAVAAEAGTGYVLKGAAPELPFPETPGAFDAATLQRLREAAAELGLREGFSVKALNMDGSEKGDAAFAAAVLACFDVEAFEADTEGNALTFSYAFGISDVTADPKGAQVTVTASVEGASFRVGTTLRLVSAEDPSVTLAEAPVTVSEAAGRTLTLSFGMTQSCQLFRAQVVSEAEAE